MIFLTATLKLSAPYCVSLSPLFTISTKYLPIFTLGAVNDLNPSLRLGDEGIDSVLLTLESIRQRALSESLPLITHRNPRILFH